MGTHPPRLPDLTDEIAPGDPGRTPGDDPSRRGFLKRVAVGGAVLAVGSQVVPVGGLVPAATGQEDGGSGDDEGVTTDPDEEQVIFLAGVALASAEAFSLAEGASGLSEGVLGTLRSQGAHSSTQADDLNGLLPEDIGTVTAPNPTLVDEVTAALEGSDQTAALAALADLQDRVGATYLAALGQIGDINDARLVASLVPVPGQTAALLRTLADPSVDPASLVPDTLTTEGALTPSEYPPAAPGEEVPDPEGETEPETGTGAGGGPGDDPGTDPDASTGEGTEEGSGATGGSETDTTEG